jgi:hypothetical protein
VYGLYGSTSCDFVVSECVDRDCSGLTSSHGGHGHWPLLAVAVAVAGSGSLLRMRVRFKGSSTTPRARTKAFFSEDPCIRRRLFDGFMAIHPASCFLRCSGEKAVLQR